MWAFGLLVIQAQPALSTAGREAVGITAVARGSRVLGMWLMQRQVNVHGRGRTQQGPQKDPVSGLVPFGIIGAGDRRSVHIPR